MSERTNDPERIYLEPPPYSPEGRLWCEDDVWPLDGDGPGGVEYIRADLAAPEPGGEDETLESRAYEIAHWIATEARVAESLDRSVAPIESEGARRIVALASARPTPAASEDVRELAVEIIRSLDLIARNYDSYEYGLPVMTHYDEMVDTVAALLRTPRGEGCRMVDETYCATHDCGAHDDEKCGRPGCQHCDAQTVGDRHRLSRHLLALASVIEDGGKPSHSMADDVRRAAAALVYTPPPRAMRQVTDRLASLLDADADWLHDEALAGRLPDRCQTVAERIRAALRSEASGQGGIHPDPETWRCRQCGGYADHYRDCPALRSEAQGEVWREVDSLLARLERYEFDTAGESEAYWTVVAMRDRIGPLVRRATLEAQGEEDAVRRAWELAVQRAYGCLDYCGGYRGAELEAFHSGIKTVIRALEAGPDTVDTQTAALDRIGAALRSEAQGEGWQVTEPARDIVRREMPETRATVREAIRAARRGEGGGE